MWCYRVVETEVDGKPAVYVAGMQSWEEDDWICLLEEKFSWGDAEKAAINYAIQHDMPYEPNNSYDLEMYQVAKAKYDKENPKSGNRYHVIYPGGDRDKIMVKLLNRDDDLDFDAYALASRHSFDQSSDAISYAKKLAIKNEKAYIQFKEGNHDFLD